MPPRIVNKFGTFYFAHPRDRQAAAHKEVMPDAVFNHISLTALANPLIHKLVTEALRLHKPMLYRTAISHISASVYWKTRPRDRSNDAAN